MKYLLINIGAVVAASGGGQLMGAGEIWPASVLLFVAGWSVSHVGIVADRRTRERKS